MKIWVIITIQHLIFTKSHSVFFAELFWMQQMPSAVVWPRIFQSLHQLWVPALRLENSWLRVLFNQYFEYISPLVTCIQGYVAFLYLRLCFFFAPFSKSKLYFLFLPFWVHCALLFVFIWGITLWASWINTQACLFRRIKFSTIIVSINHCSLVFFPPLLPESWVWRLFVLLVLTKCLKLS